MSAQDMRAQRAVTNAEVWQRLDDRQAARASRGENPFLSPDASVIALMAAVNGLYAASPGQRRSAALTVAAEAVAVVEQIDGERRR